VSAFKDKDACQKSRWLPDTLQALSIGLPSPRTADWYKIEDILGTALNQALIEKGNAKRHLDAAASEASAFLKGAGYAVG
jgi:multiple sugar transport system substrate-binding protein